MPATRRASRPRSARARELGHSAGATRLRAAASRWPRCSTRAPGWPSGTAPCASCWPSAARGSGPDTVRHVIARAIGLSATDDLRGAVPAARTAAPQLRTLWQQVDVLMVPTAPGHPRFAEVDADPVGVNARLGTYTNFVNLLGWCALALPAGSHADRPALRRDLHRRGRRRRRRWLDLARRWQGWTAAPAAAAAAPSTVAASRTLPIAVVGAHLSGLPLNGQLLERGAMLRESTRTAPAYRLLRAARHRARPSPACCAWPTAAPPSRSRSGTCRRRSWARFLR